MKNFLKNFLLAASLITPFLSSYAQLNGIYTVGQGGNYPSITSAVNALNTDGVDGPVIFNILPGNYGEQVAIDSIKGASSVNTVTFKSGTNDTASVLWYPVNSLKNYIVKINGADFLSFKNITFINDYNSVIISDLISIQPYSENVNITDNLFKFITYGRIDSTYRIISMMSGNSNNLTISGNTFIAVNSSFIYKYAVYINSGSNLKVSGNSFINFRTSVSLNNVNSPLIEKNDFTTEGNYGTYKGVVLYFCTGAIKVLKNKFSLAATNFGNAACDALELNGCTGNNSAVIANNFFSSGTNTRSVRINGSTSIGCYFNSTHCHGWFSENFSIANSNMIICKNNLLTNYTGDFRYGAPLILNSSNILSDYNNFNRSSSIVARINSNNVYTLAELINITGNDSNSNETWVNFISETDLHLTGSAINNPDLLGTPVAGITDDIDGNPRDPVKPMMGAHEGRTFTSARLFLHAFIEGFYDEQTGSQTGDTMKAFLHEPSSPYNIADQSITFLKPNGIAVFDFPYVQNGMYYISVKHRNSIETWCQTSGQTFIAGAYTVYDLSSDISQAYGNNLTLKGNKYCLYSGDTDQNGIVDAEDLILIHGDIGAFATGYISTDVNGDSITDVSDILITFNNSTNVVQVITP